MSDQQRALATRIVAEAGRDQRLALHDWLSHLLVIRRSNAPTPTKAARAVAVTLRARFIIAIAKTLAVEVKRHGWDNRSAAMRWGIGGAGAGLAFFGSKPAGLAALGGAVAVPLWIVFGAGATFAKVVLDEIAGRP